MRKPTIAEVLNAKLGRVATDKELCLEVRRILFGEPVPWAISNQ